MNIRLLFGEMLYFAFLL